MDSSMISLSKILITNEYLDRSVGYHRMPTSELSPSMKR